MSRIRRDRERRKVRRPPMAEALEDRALLSQVVYEPTGPAITVSTYDGSEQRAPQVAMNAAGNFTVAWEDTGLDSSGLGVYARRFGTDGAPLGNQFRVNTRLEGDQGRPDVAVDDAGDTLIAWTDAGSGTYLQRYAPDGSKVGENVKVSDFGNAAALMTPAGASAVGWLDSAHLIVGFQRYAADRTPTARFTIPWSSLDHGVDGWAAEFGTGLGNPLARVRMSDDGTIDLTWALYRDRFVPDVGRRYDGQAWLRRLDQAGNPIGSDVLIASVTDSAVPIVHLQPSVAPRHDGGFLATYIDQGRSMIGRQYSAAGAPQGAPFVLLDYAQPEVSIDYYATTDVAVLSDGNVAVAWCNPGAFDFDQDYTRVFAPDGTPVSPYLLVSNTEDYNWEFSIGTDGSGGFALAWSGGGNDAFDSFARRYVRTEVLSTIQLDPADSAADEDAGTATVTVTRSGDTSAAASVVFQTTDGGTATPGVDFRPVTVTLNFAPGEVSKRVDIPLIDDNEVEGDETVGLLLSDVNGTGTRLGPAAAGTLTIRDVESVGAFRFEAASYAVREDAGTVVLVVDRVGGSSGWTSVRYAMVDGTATGGPDYEPTTGDLAFASGETSRTIAVPIRADGAMEGPETFSVVLSDPTNGATLGAPSTATVTIDDVNGLGAFRFEQSAATVAEDGGSVALTVLYFGTQGPVTVDYATSDGSAHAGHDYAATAGTLTFQAGEVSKVIRVPILDDAEVEGDELFNVVLTAAGGGATIATPSAVGVTITDVETAGRFAFGAPRYEVVEGAPAAVLDVVRLGGAVGGVTVAYATEDGTAIAGEDYEASSGTLTFGAGETSKTIAIPIRSDDDAEAVEEFHVRLSSPTGGATLGEPAVAAVEITDRGTGGAACVAGDYDGDRRTDLALYRYDAAAGRAVFELRLSNGGSPTIATRSIAGVGPNVIPVTGDFDGDGKADVAVVDPMAKLNGSTVPNATVWIILQSSKGDARLEVPFGAAGSLDRPAPADFDGDGITDIATFRADSDLVPGAAQWFVLPSGSGGAFPVVFGAAGGTDLPAPFDFDGDGKADIATFRPVSDLVPGAAQWFILPSGPNPGYRTTTGAFPVTFGAAGNADQPAVADYNGDGRDDIAAFRSESDLAPGHAQWFVLPSAGAAPDFGSGFPVTFGTAGAIAAVGDYDGDGRPDLAVFDPASGMWSIRAGTEPPEQSVAFGSADPKAVPVLSPLYFRLVATGNPTTTSPTTTAAVAGIDDFVGSARQRPSPDLGLALFDQGTAAEVVGRASAARGRDGGRGRGDLVDLAIGELVAGDGAAA